MSVIVKKFRLKIVIRNPYDQPGSISDRRVFEVNVTTPLYIFDTSWGVIGSIYTE